MTNKEVTSLLKELWEDLPDACSPYTDEHRKALRLAIEKLEAEEREWIPDRLWLEMNF